MQERGQEKLYAPEEISSFVLEELREAAQQHFGQGKLVADAVITVPAYFNDDQKQVVRPRTQPGLLSLTSRCARNMPASRHLRSSTPIASALVNMAVLSSHGVTCLLTRHMCCI